MSEQRYTLAEARIELARQECQQDGHDWRLVEPPPTYADLHPDPVAVRCDRCTERRAVVPVPD